MASIKVNRVSLINELEAAKQRLLDESKTIEAQWVEYEKAVNAWAAKVVKQGKDFEADAYGEYVRVTAPKSLPKPKKPSEARPTEKRYYYDFTRRGEYSSLNEVTARKVAEIDNTLKLLKLSSEDSVSATAYKSVSQYL